MHYEVVSSIPSWDITDEATKWKKQEAIKKKFHWQWEQKISSDSDKFMISEKPIQPKPEHS